VLVGVPRRVLFPSQSQSYFVIGGQSVRLAVSPSGTHDQILVVVKTVVDLFVVGRSV
jgi:hypothetical protein